MSGEDREPCSQHVFSGGRDVSGHQCYKRGVVKCGGKWYCAIHDPEAVAKRREAQTKKYRAEQARQIKFWNREKRAYDALDNKLPKALKRVAELELLVKRLGSKVTGKVWQAAVVRIDPKARCVNAVDVCNAIINERRRALKTGGD